MPIWLDEIEDYRLDYSDLSRNGGVPKIKPIIAHAKRRFKQRFGEEFEGTYGSAYQAIAKLINIGLCECDIYQIIDYYFGFIADKVVHSFGCIYKFRLSFFTFIDQNRRNKKSNEDWFQYCLHLKNISKKFNQSTTDLDTILEGICETLPERKLSIKN